MRKHHWCEQNFHSFIFFMQYFIIVATSILSRNDSRLIKLAQCVNLIRRLFLVFDLTHPHTHFVHCASISSCMCADSPDLLKFGNEREREREREKSHIESIFVWHTISVHSSRKEIVLSIEWNWYDTLKMLFLYCCAHKLMLIYFFPYSCSLAFCRLPTSIVN